LSKFNFSQFVSPLLRPDNLDIFPDTPDSPEYPKRISGEFGLWTDNYLKFVIFLFDYSTPLSRHLDPFNTPELAQRGHPSHLQLDTLFESELVLSADSSLPLWHPQAASTGLAAVA
jgi:hypothetical protein